MKKFVSKSSFAILVKISLSNLVLFLLLSIGYLTLTGKSKWSGRSMTLLDPTYAKKYIPIIASVSEH